MELEEFRQSLINDVEAQSLSDSEFPEAIFLESYCKDVLIGDYGALSDLEIIQYDKAPNNPKFRNMHIDAAYLEISANTLTLVYCDYNKGEIVPINNELVRNKTGLLRNFVSNALKGYFSDTAEGDPATELGRDIVRKKDDIYKLQLVYASTNKKADRIKQAWENDPLEVGTKKLDINLIVLDIEDICKSFQGTNREKIDIETKDFGYPKGIPCIKANIESEDYDSYLAVVPGQFLASIYLEYNARLLESNVRSFLNTRGAVNKGIQATILNEPSRFFAYNNGIAATADKIEIKNDVSGMHITKFENLQIINGGQTTASLTSAQMKYGVDLSGIYVQMKLSIIKNADQADELVRLISTYANRQNKVTNADLNSNHPYYSRIEMLSRSVMCPPMPNVMYQTYWFFERSRGQYEQKKMLLQTKSERDKFDRINPKSQKFTKTDLAKYINAADQLPHYVACGAELNLAKFQESIDKSWSKNGDVSVNEDYYKKAIAKAIMYKAIDRIVLKSEWYQSDRAYKSSIVPYTFAKFAYEVNSLKKNINYSRIWNRQEVPDEYIQDLEKIALVVYKAINSSARFSVASNIGEYTKKEACWNAIKAISFSLSDKTKTCLIDPDDEKDTAKAARKDQIVTNSATNLIDIYNAGVAYWNKVLDLGDTVLGFTYYNKSLCKKAIDYINGKTTFINDKEVKELGKIMRDMEGYNVLPEGK